MVFENDINSRQYNSFQADSTDNNPNRRVIIKEIAAGVSIPLSATAHSSVAIVYHQHSTPITTSAYTQIVASTTDVINNLQIFDSSGQMLVLAVGAVGLEIDKLLIFPGGNGSVDLTIPSGSRLSLKAVTGNSTAGYFALTGIK